MFGLLNSVAKAAVAVVALPVAAVVDVAETVVDPFSNVQKPSRTGGILDAVFDNLEEAVDPRK